MSDKNKMLPINFKKYGKAALFIYNRVHSGCNSLPWSAAHGGIQQRCNNPKNPGYKNYGGRGIKCLISKDELRHSFMRDRAYLMKKPSVDRIDNDGNYEKGNVHWMELSDNSSKRGYPLKEYMENRSSTKLDRHCIFIQIGLLEKIAKRAAKERMSANTLVRMILRDSFKNKEDVC